MGDIEDVPDVLENFVGSRGSGCERRETEHEGGGYQHLDTERDHLNLRDRPGQLSQKGVGKRLEYVQTAPWLGYSRS